MPHSFVMTIVPGKRKRPGQLRRYWRRKFKRMAEQFAAEIDLRCYNNSQGGGNAA